MKPNCTLRLDPDLVARARADGINLVKLTEEAIKKALSLKECPYCGAKQPKRRAK